MKFLKSCMVLLGALTSLAASGLDSPTPEFAADIVRHDAHDGTAVTVGRLFAARGKVRIEATELPDGFFLIDPATSTWWVRPAQRVYMNARMSSPLTQIFVPIDVRNPCVQWRTALQDAGAGKSAERWSCERSGDSMFRIGVGSSAAEDRPAHDRASEQRFISRQLQFPVKALGADGVSLTLENLHIAPQPAELFSVPSGYREFDPQVLVERIKHSDVWAAPADR